MRVFPLRFHPTAPGERWVSLAEAGWGGHCIGAGNRGGLGACLEIEVKGLVQGGEEEVRRNARVLVSEQCRCPPQGQGGKNREGPGLGRDCLLFWTG